MSIRERIEGLKRYECGTMYDGGHMYENANGDYLERSDVLEAVAEAWQSERPTLGRWWVAIHPGQRHHFDRGFVFEATLSDTMIHCKYGSFADLSRFEGAEYAPYRAPQDPFAGRGA